MLTAKMSRGLCVYSQNVTGFVFVAKISQAKMPQAISNSVSFLGSKGMFMAKMEKAMEKMAEKEQVLASHQPHPENYTYLWQISRVPCRANA